ncbi:G-patch domain and KOW motifs-containing protein [Chironomus tepperi]|uniref:G-patch domain and KOW motifs-containing protein n=1 Tax=Chironomus tepperi TaxID=113505 RepID=UPI00391FADFB
MENTTAKISFGFKKTTDKPNFLKNKIENVKEAKKIELIESIEGSQLKIHGKDPNEDELKKLVIPMTNDQKTRPISKLIESRRIKKEKEENGEKPNGNAETPMEVDETLEQKAAREILEDLKNTGIKKENTDFEVPLHPDELPLDGAVESTLDDYERVNIADFGKAMLRGMGWKDEQEKDDPHKFDVPMVRPKGLGLGADKAVKKQKLLVQPAPNEVLEIKKRAFIKVLAGKHKNMYGTIEGFDDGGGRLIIKLAIGGLKVLMNEFMVQPISKQEYEKYSKILNSEKYEEFKNDENKTSSAATDKPVKVERRSRSISPSTSRAKDDNKASRSRDEQIVSRGRDENRRNKSHERERERSRERNRRRSRERASNYYKKDKRHYSSDSEDDKTYNRKYNERQRSRSHDKHRRRHSSSDSSSERQRSKKKSSKKSSKSKSKKNSSPERYHSSDDERHHKRKYKRSKHHRDRS